MATNNGSNRREELYEGAPDKRAERKAIIERGMDLTEEKARLQVLEPLDEATVNAIDVQLQAAEDDYVSLMKLEFGRNANEARLRRRFQSKINRQARQSLSYDINHDIDMDPIDMNVDLNVNVSDAPGTSSQTQRAGGMERIAADYAIDDVRSDSRERREVIRMDMDIEDYVSNHNALIVIAQKFRESQPQLLASSLKGGDDVEYAIRTAFYPFPAKAEQMITELREGGSAAEGAKALVLELAKNLEPYMEHSLEREELGVEMARDSLLKEGGSRLGKVIDEFQRHPVGALVGTAALVAAIAAAWHFSGPKLKKAMGWTAAGGATLVGGAILGNMLWRSQTDDGSDMWDALGFKPEDLSPDGTRLEAMQSKFPELALENDQSARDLMVMLDADVENVYDVFNDSFRKGDTSINVRDLARKDSDVEYSEASSMNGKASYTALKGYFILLAEKTAKANGTSLRGKSERQKIEEGLLIFRQRFVNRPEELNLESAILMTIDKADARAAATATGTASAIEMGTSTLSETEVAAERRINEGLKLHGMEADVEYIGHHDGADWVLIDGFPWQYKYQSERELHTFTDTVTGTVRNVGKTVRDPIVADSHTLAQSRVNSYYPATPLNAASTIEWDKSAKEWRTITKVPSPAVPYLNLAARESHIGINFDPKNGLKPYVYIFDSKDKTGSPDYNKVIEQYHTARVEEALNIHLKPLMGNLGLDVVGYDDPSALTTPTEGRIKFKWGPSLEFEGQAKFLSGKISTAPGDFVLYSSPTGPAPEVIVAQWEAAGDQMADVLVDNNPQVEAAYKGLASVFAGKDGTPQSVGDVWTFIEANFNLENEDTVWAEAVNFQKGVLHAEVKRAVVQAHRDDPIGMLDATTREAKMEQIRTTIVAPRISDIIQRSVEVASAANEGGQLSAVKKAEALELRKMGMTPEYLKWLEKFELAMKNKAGLDTVGMEGQERARLIHDAILLTIIEYSTPMHESTTTFNSTEAQKWRANLDRVFPLIIAMAIHDQEGNWWIDQRYNAAGFEKMLLEQAPPIRPWRSMDEDLKGFVGSTSGSLSIPFYEPDYERGALGGRERRRVRVNQVPAPMEGEASIDYRIRLTEYIQDAARELYSEVDDLEYSLREDEFDNFLNWRVSRAVEVFIEDTSPTWLTPQQMELKAKDAVTKLKTDTLELKHYQQYLHPEGLLDMLNPRMEANLDVLTEAEYQIAKSMLLETHSASWEEDTQEVLEWLNSRYKNEDIAGFGVPWVRTDIMRLWMEKIGYGLPYGPQGDGFDSSKIKDTREYRKFFTNVAQDLMPREAFSLTDPTSMFRRTDVYGWKEIQGSLEEIPSYDEWLALGSPARAEVDSLDWKENEIIREHQEVRAQVEGFMDHYDKDLDVSKFTRFDGRWPELHRSHVLERLEGDVLRKATDSTTGRVDPDKLRLELNRYSQFVEKEVVFLNYIIESKIEATDGSSHASLVTAAFIGLGAVGGTAAGAMMAVPAMAATTVVTANPGIGTGAGVAAGVLGGAGGGALGGLLGYGAGYLYEQFPLPQIGMQTGEQAHSRIKGLMNTAFDAQYVNSTSPNPNDYFDALQTELASKIKEAIAYDASSMDLGPVSIYMDGGNFDRVQIAP